MQQGTMGFAEPPVPARRARARAKVLAITLDVLAGIEFRDPDLARAARQLGARLRKRSEWWQERAESLGWKIPEGMG
jgi:hypothetical protein